MKSSLGVLALVGALALMPSLDHPAAAQGAGPAETPRGSPNGPFSSNVSPGTVSPDKSHRVSINSATEAELAGLPAVGGTLAKAIVAGRPYREPDELVQRNILPETVFSRIKDLVF